jgi:hypothetical protein
MVGLAVITGLVGGLKFGHILKLIVKGMAGNVGLFFLFLLLEPFINFIELAGGFKALAFILNPLVDLGGKTAILPHIGLNKEFPFESHVEFIEHILRTATHNRGLSILVTPPTRTTWSIS